MPQAVRAGDLRFRVRFEARVEVENEGGGTTSTWEEQFTRWADIRPSMGGEQVMAQRLEGVQPVLIFVIYDPETKTITPDWRAVELECGEPARYYALKTAEDMERKRRHITMLAIAGSPDGGAGP